MKKNVLRAKWSKKENDIMIYYPSRSDGCFLHGIISHKHYTWNGKIEPSFKKELEDRGYDIKTLKIYCEKIK